MSNDLLAEKSSRERAVRDAQFTLFGLQSDEKKLEHAQADLQLSVHQMRSEMSRLKANLEGKEFLLKSVEQKLHLAKEDSAQAKKKINSL